jgi:hypothetical protein
MLALLVSADHGEGTHLCVSIIWKPLVAILIIVSLQIRCIDSMLWCPAHGGYSVPPAGAFLLLLPEKLELRNVEIEKNVFSLKRKSIFWHQLSASPW